MNELEMFFGAWDRQAQGALKLLKSLPADQYDYRRQLQLRHEAAQHRAAADCGRAGIGF